jgi:organic radical activating enzyme
MSYDNPNFTIITPGGCNAFCSFCTDPFKRKASPDYLANLVNVLASGLPDHFRQVSISGGEPTLSPLLKAILDLLHMSNHFDKVVLTTNGARLKECVPLLKGRIHHLNVSRHAIGEEANAQVFGTSDIISDKDLKAVAFELNKAGIDVNFNFVYDKNSQLTVDFVLRYLAYARECGASSVSFRYDQNENSLEPTYLEKLFSDWTAVHQGGCPVCRNHTLLIGGFPVVFKASFAEPSRAIADVYELIYHIDGRLCTDWEATQELTPNDAKSYVADFAREPHKEHQVVTHTVSAPRVPVKGQRAPATLQSLVVPLGPVAPVPGAAPIRKPSTSRGGGCGTSSSGRGGGGCGT